MKRVVFLDTPCGPLGVAASEDAVTDIYFGDAPRKDMERGTTPLLEQAVSELAEYFAGHRQAFSFPIATSGTPFQEAVWKALRTIPYGQTCSYGQIALQIGRPQAVRAVGMANHRNPLCIATPCHRVIGAGGSLTGYAGGLDKKEFLLALERGTIPMQDERTD